MLQEQSSGDDLIRRIFFAPLRLRGKNPATATMMDNTKFKTAKTLRRKVSLDVNDK